MISKLIRSTIWYLQRTFCFCKQPETVNMSCKDEPINFSVVYQPLTAALRQRLDPEYVTFHEKYVQYVPPDDTIPWDGSSRTRKNWPYAGSSIVEVGSVVDIDVCNRFRVRVFTPKCARPDAGWPVLIWFHGGGWANGSIDSDNDLCSMVCQELDCLVLNVDYRLAPEHPFPAAIDDAVETLKWVTNDSSSQLGGNAGNIALGGASSGANIAAVLSMKAAELKIPAYLIAQVLVVPVCDNTATTRTYWQAHADAAWLGPGRMTWYRKMYLRKPADALKWEASPLLAAPDLLATSPPTWIAIAGQDMLSIEGIAFAGKLRDAGVRTTINTYEGTPHSMMSLSGRRRAFNHAQITLTTSRSASERSSMSTRSHTSPFDIVQAFEDLICLTGSLAVASVLLLQMIGVGCLNICCIVRWLSRAFVTLCPSF